MAPPVPAARRRNLQVYATDPMSGRRSSFRVVVDVPNEPNLLPGPQGDLIEVIDYDGSQNCYYEPVSLNDPALLMTSGLAPNDADPRFHQQMVYAVASKVIESARRALGRPITFRRSARQPRLKMLPHAFYGANAFFDRRLNAVLFGYFRASTSQPGANLPGQMVFSCLSHDIIAHEVTHAIVHRLRPYFIEPTNPDVLAFHEAFSDLVALFQRFTYRDILRDQIRTARAKLRSIELLTDLAPQFGYASGMREALRSAVRKADPQAFAKTRGAHARGAILMGAVFDGFFRTYVRRVADLLRLGGVAEGQLSATLDPDLVDRITNEVASLADYVLRMCFRAFDYLPPLDLTFGDFLRALVTADYEVNPRDPTELRFNIIEAFRERGIYADVASLAEEALLLRLPDHLDPPRLDEAVLPHLAELFVTTAGALDETARPELPSTVTTTKKTPRGPSSFESYERQVGEGFAEDDDLQSDASIGMAAMDEDFGDRDEPTRKRLSDDSKVRSDIAVALATYGCLNADILGLVDAPDRPIAVKGFSPVYRVGVDQRLIVELVVQYVQTDRSRDTGGLHPRAGTTVVFDSKGYVRHIIAKPLTHPANAPRYAGLAAQREERTSAYIDDLDLNDPRMAWPDAAYESQRMQLRMDLRALHGGGS